MTKRHSSLTTKGVLPYYQFSDILAKYTQTILVFAIIIRLVMSDKAHPLHHQTNQTPFPPPNDMHFQRQARYAHKSCKRTKSCKEFYSSLREIVQVVYSIIVDKVKTEAEKSAFLTPDLLLPLSDSWPQTPKLLRMHVSLHVPFQSDFPFPFQIVTIGRKLKREVALAMKKRRCEETP